MGTPSRLNSGKGLEHKDSNAENQLSEMADNRFVLSQYLYEASVHDEERNISSIGVLPDLPSKVYEDSISMRSIHLKSKSSMKGKKRLCIKYEGMISQRKLKASLDQVVAKKDRKVAVINHPHTAP